MPDSLHVDSVASLPMGNHVATPESASRRSAIGWILYDFSNVIFATNIVSVYFPIWIVDQAGRRDSDYGLVNGGSMALVFLLAPFLGATLDRLPRRLPVLMLTTAVSCLLVSLIGLGSSGAALALFFAANAVFQLGVMVYDSLLPVVSVAERRGWLSGLGIAAGFGGSVVGLLIGISVLSFDADAKPLVFKLTALAFFLASIPCFLWVKEPPHHREQMRVGAIWRETVADVRASRAFLRTQPRQRRFLIGRFAYIDAANTFFAFLGIYATKELGFSDFAVQLLLLAGILIGPLGALGAGRMADQIGPLRTLRRGLLIWLAVFVLAAGVPLLGLPSALFWLIAPLAGIAIGSTPTTDRPVLIELAPPEEFGRCMGLFAMIGRFSSVTGPLVWAAIVTGLGWGRPVAVATLAVVMLFGWWYLAPLERG